MKKPIPVVHKFSGIEQLFDDKQLVADIHRSYGSIDKLITECQRLVVTEENMDKIGPVVLAMSEIQKVMLLFKMEGESLKKEADKQSPDTHHARTRTDD